MIKVHASSFDGLMDPLLGFEHFRMRTQAFRPRPYAGMSMMTYLFKDSAPYHVLDTLGTDHTLEPEGFIWTRTGRGLVRTAFPEPEGQFSHGLQILLNIPSKDKLLDPKTIAIDAHAIPERISEGIETKVVIGQHADCAALIDLLGEFTFLHVKMATGKRFIYDLPIGWSATAHVLGGAIRMQTNVGITYLGPEITVALGQSSFEERLSFIAHTQSELLLFSGLPTMEQTCNAGTMFMSSTEDLGKAIADYEEGKMGFITLIDRKWQVISPI